MKLILPLLLILTSATSFADSAAIEQELSSCVSAAGIVLPTLITCKQHAVSEIDTEISRVEALIISSAPSAPDAHGLSLKSLLEKSLPQEVQSMQAYRQSASTVSAILEDGTGAEDQNVQYGTQVSISLSELKTLETRLSN